MMSPKYSALSIKFEADIDNSNNFYLFFIF